jgi:hypothetical protein
MAFARHLALPVAATLLAAAGARADIADASLAPAPWTLAARTFALSPRVPDADSGDTPAARAFRAEAWHRNGVGLQIDGEWRRDAHPGRAGNSVFADLGLGARIVEAGPLRLDLLAGARVDAAIAAADAPVGRAGGSILPEAAVAPMAGARAVLGITESMSLNLRVGVAPDASLEAEWRMSAGLRIDLARDVAFMIDARWNSADASPSAVTGFPDGIGRASAWAGFSMPF